MKFILAAVLFVAVAQAAIQPRNIEIPEWALNPRFTGAEWQEILANQEVKPEVVANYKAGTQRQIDGAGAIRGDIDDSKIIGGSNAVAAQFPWQVSVTMDGSYFCGGSVISQNWVLTAGHCVDGISSFRTVFGSLTPDGGAAGTSSQTSRSSILHNAYNANTIANDIGLIELTTALTWSSSVGPVRLPSRSLVGTTFAGQSARVSGWGKTSDTAGGISSVLKFADLNIITNAVCAQTYGNIVRATNICASTSNGQSTCNGDSGGPLVFQENDGLYTEIGIVSFGSSAGCAKGYDVAFTRVTEYLGWIESNSGISIP